MKNNDDLDALLMGCDGVRDWRVFYLIPMFHVTDKDITRRYGALASLFFLFPAC
jgi:hypothetical protein